VRGRVAECEQVLGLLRSTKGGQGGLLLVEGDPGMGKSLLLTAAGREAERLGLTLVAVAADELSQAMPLAPLLTAVNAGTGPAAFAIATATDPRQPGPAPGRDVILGLLEKLASAGPVLVTIDDIQWADPGTLQALLSMPRLLAAYPLSWILAMARSPHTGGAERLFDLLERDGATRVVLGPLDDEAQLALVTDVLGAVPDATLTELAASASGNPFILTEAFRGLLDENAITISEGRASLASAQVTERIQTVARDRLKGLSPGARRFAETASILGKSFRLEDVAEILGESPGALLAALDEALAAHLLVATPDGLAFQHEFVRRAVAYLLPEPIRQALPWPGSIAPWRSCCPSPRRPRPTWRPARSCSPCRPTPGGRPAPRPRCRRSRPRASGKRRRRWSVPRSRCPCPRRTARRCGARCRGCSA